MRPHLIPLKDRSRGGRVAPLKGRVTLDFPWRRGHVLSSHQPIGQYRRATRLLVFPRTFESRTRAVCARLIANFVFRLQMLFLATNCDARICLCYVGGRRNFKAREERGETDERGSRRVEKLPKIVEIIALEMSRIVY